MPKIRVRPEFAGLNRLIRKVGNDALIAAPWRKVVEKGARDLEQRVLDRVPSGETHQLEQSIARYVDPRPIPTVAMITANAVSVGGFRYGWALQSSKKKVIYHYRSGSRAGRKTRFWFSGAMRGFRKALDPLLRQAAQEIEARWRR